MHYLCTLSTHTMDYINAATSGILSPHVLSVSDLQKMLQHIADTLPPTLHLPILPVDTLHIYRYLHTHVLIKNNQFLLLIDIPIQDRAHQITIHQVFTLDIPHETTHPIMTLTRDTLESPTMPLWDWNYPAHNLRYANRQMDSSAKSLHLSNLWLIHQYASLPSMPRVKLA